MLWKFQALVPNLGEPETSIGYPHKSFDDVNGHNLGMMCMICMISHDIPPLLGAK